MCFIILYILWPENCKGDVYVWESEQNWTASSGIRLFDSVIGYVELRFAEFCKLCKTFFFWEGGGGLIMNSYLLNCLAITMHTLLSATLNPL